MASRFVVAVPMLFVACSLTNSLDDLSGNKPKDGGGSGGGDASLGGAGGLGNAGGLGASGGSGGSGATGAVAGSGGASGSGAAGGSGGVAGAGGSGAVSGSGGGGGGGTGGVGGSVGGSGGGNPACTGGHLPITDDFSDGIIGSIWSPTADPGLTIVESSGLLKILFAASVAANAWAALDSNQSYDLTSCSVILHVVAAPTVAETFLALGVMKDNDNYFEYDVNTGELSAAAQLAGAYTGLKSAPFSPTQHAWWKIGEQGGNIIWELSSDGKNWVQFYSQPAPFAVTSVLVFVGAGADQTTSQSTAAFVDDFDLPPP